MSISRRGFLKGLAVGGALVPGVAQAGGPRYFPGYPGRMGLLHDTTLCVGCRACEAACNAENKLGPLEVPAYDMSVYDKPGGRKLSDKLYTVVNRYPHQPTLGRPPVFRKHQCMHCNEPCCASVCFVKAFVKTPEGPILYKPELCVGCRYCVFACPYYALAYEYGDPLKPRVVRCTMCYSRITDKENPRIPACAEACPMGAIQYGEREELLKVAHDRMRRYPRRYRNEIFGENEYGGTSWLTLSGVSFDRLNLPINLSRDPLPNLTTSFLGLAPLVAAIAPGLLAGVYAFTRRKEIVAETALRGARSEERTRMAAELESRLQEAAEQAERDRERAVARAVRSALREVREAAAAESAASGQGKSPSTPAVEAAAPEGGKK